MGTFVGTCLSHTQALNASISWFTPARKPNVSPWNIGSDEYRKRLYHIKRDLMLNKPLVDQKFQHETCMIKDNIEKCFNLYHMPNEQF